MRLIAKMRLPALLAWVIPVREVGNNRDICIGLEAWRDVLDAAGGSSGTPEEVTIEAAAVLYEILDELGVSPEEVFDGPLLAYADTLLEMPAYLREAHCLTLAERAQLCDARAPAPPGIIDDAKWQTVAQLTAERSAATDGAVGRGPAYVLGVLLSRVRVLSDAGGIPVEPCPVDRDDVLRSFDELDRRCPHLRHVEVGGRPVPDVFRGRMARLGTPELVLVRALFTGSLLPVAVGQWMDALHAESNPSVT